MYRFIHRHRYPPLFKSSLYPTFTKDLHAYLFREPKEIQRFSLLWKRQKVETASVFVLQWASQRQRHLSSENRPVKLLLGNHTQHPSLSCWSCELRLWASVLRPHRSVRLWARQVLKSALLCFMLFRFTKGFIGTLLLFGCDTWIYII